MLKSAFVVLVAMLLVSGSPVASFSQDREATCSAAGTGSCSAEEYLLDRLDRDGLRAALAALDSLAAVDENVRRDGHMFAHAIGLAAYPSQGPVSDVFAICTPSFQSGCHHGVIQSYFEEHGRTHGEHIDASMVNALCASQREDGAGEWLLFQCTHGLGHGLMMIVDNDLPRALDACDLLTSSWEREVCYGAAFMENIVHAISPHHAVGRPENSGDPGSHAAGGADAAAEHDHAGHGAPTATPAVTGSASGSFVAIRSDDPLYPCSVLADRFLPACYQMQTSVIMYMTGQDVDATARVCLTAPEMYRSTCFQSLGRDISALTVQDHPRAIRLCDRSPTEFQPFCHLGYSKNLVDLTADLTDGIEYCRLLQSGDSKRVCYTGVGEQAWVLHSDPGTRANACASVEVDYVQDCRRGAGLVEDPQSASSGPIEAPANLEHPRIADRMRRAASPPG